MPELLSIYRTWLKDDSIVGQKLEKRIACPFHRRGSSKGALCFDNREPVCLTYISFLSKRKRSERQRTNQKISGKRKPAFNESSVHSECYLGQIRYYLGISLREKII